MLNRWHDPQGAAEIWQAKLSESIRQFMAREISDDVFRADLHSRGFHSARLGEEFRFHERERHNQETAHRRRMLTP